MVQVHVNPAVTRAEVDADFCQTVTLLHGKTVIAAAKWHLREPGVVQILAFEVTADQRRTGHGRQLLNQVIGQAREFHRQAGLPLRRMWIAVGHKSSVIARAFLTGQSFHHIGSACGILADEDMLIYVRSFD